MDSNTLIIKISCSCCRADGKLPAPLWHRDVTVAGLPLSGSDEDDVILAALNDPTLCVVVEQYLGLAGVVLVGDHAKLVVDSLNKSVGSHRVWIPLTSQPIRGDDVAKRKMRGCRRDDRDKLNFLFMFLT